MSFTKAMQAALNATTKVFGVDAVYTYANSDPDSDIKGVFGNDFVEINGVATKRPTFRIILADLTSVPAESDTVLIDSINYVVRTHEPDSFGATTLILEKI